MSNSISTSLEPYTGPWGIQEVKHFLKRTMFGAKPADIEHFSRLSFEQSYLQIIQKNSGYIAPPINSYSEKTLDPDVPYGSTWIYAPFSNQFKFDRMWSTVNWWINRTIHQDRTITEKMILFWHNHFGVALTGTMDARANVRYVNTIQNNSLGNFKNLIKEITIDPLMLNFLNGFQNDSRAPDENYARELMELFTIGKGYASNYTENDVKAAARVLTGFVYDWPLVNAIFFINKHDTGDKQFSSFFDNHVIKGISDNSKWPEEIYGLIDMIFQKKEVSTFICRKFYRFFVNYEITDEVEKNIIEPLAKLFRDTNYEIYPVIKTLLISQHFFETEIIGSMIKSPMDFYIGMIREMEPDLPNNPDPRFYSYFMDFCRKVLQGMQQDLPDPPNVAGWPAYYQHPTFGRTWINSETLKTRGIVLDVFLDINKKPRNTDVFIDLVKYSKNIPDVENPIKFIDNILKNLISFQPTAQYKEFLKKILLSNQESDYYWTNAWTDYIKNPLNENYKAIVESRLKQLFKNILHLEEYQLH